MPVADGCGIGSYFRSTITRDNWWRMPAAASMGVSRGYLFPPGFHKSQVVFNLHRAVGESARCALVVEGFFDCLQVHQAGYRNVVALLGVSLSEAQEKLLRERFPRLVLMLDGDEAGQRASQQLAKRLRGRVSLSIVKVPSGRQPDQLSSEEIGWILRRASDAPRA